MKCNFRTENDYCRLTSGTMDRCNGENCIFMKILPKINKIDKALRADILKILSHGKNPRKQPDGKNWKMCKCGHTWGNHNFESRCTICQKDNCWHEKVAQDG